MLKTLDDLLVHRALLEGDAHIGAGGVAEALGVDIEAAAGDDVGIDEVLNTLVDGGARHVALGGDILERDSGILGEDAQNLLVEIINFIHLLPFLVTICQQK